MCEDNLPLYRASLFGMIYGRIIPIKELFSLLNKEVECIKEN